jgi:extracellular factor (EF) 3-hydroxypalmitic acid methyl ester biosynthesis protein
MNQVFTGNGNGSNGHLHQAKKQAAPPAPAVSSEDHESRVTFQTAEGIKLHGALSRVTRHLAVFELYNPAVTPRFSEVLGEFTITMQSRTVYFGRAVVSKVLDAGVKMVCEAMLDAAQWADVSSELLGQRKGLIAGEFKQFIREWQKNYKVLPEFKVVVADMQTMLHDLKLWLEHVELGLWAVPAPERKDMEQQVLKQIGDLFVPAFDALHERYENISEQISNDLRPMHRAFSQRQLHPLTLCSPFAHRAYIKPLGYAGDYEMVNMIALNPFQGDTLFAKIVNLWFLSQWPSKAHRNRLAYLKERLENETWRVTRARRPARIFNFACGPAIEVQRFLADFRGCEQAEFTLADFNEQTLEYLSQATGSIKKRLALRTSIRFQKKSVNQLIKEHLTAKRKGEKPAYDLIYCAGLFDYLPDNICRQLMEIFYSWLAPDGLLAATNVDSDKPFRQMLEFVLDWHLIYRDVEGCKSLIPEGVPDDARRVMKDQTGVNIFIEVRKPHCE